MPIPEALTDEQKAVIESCKAIKLPQMSNDLIAELGFIYCKDNPKIPSPFPITFAEFLQMVVAPNKSELDMSYDAHILERLVTYYNHTVKDQWPYTFTQFVEKVNNGVWEARFAA